MKARINKRSPLVNGTLVLVMIGLMIGGTGCEKWYGIPQEKDYLSEKADLKTKDFTPVLGRTTVMTGNLDPDGSTTPLNYEIINIRNSDGTSTEALSTKRPTYVWTDDYDGNEKSLEEIEAKRKLEDHPAFEVRRSGDFYLWASATNSALPNYQGSTAPAQTGGYLFDVKISNSGGERILKGFTLRPQRERPFEPSERDPITGVQLAPITPTISSNMIGVATRKSLSNSYSGTDTAKRDVRVLFKKTGNGNSLTFKFLDKNFKPIDPHLFNLTDWDNLVHGFNSHIGNESVTYNVAYPIPLTTRPTKYTSANGSQAKIRFGYYRLGYNGVRQESYIDFSFNIFEKGDWEIAFQFRYDNPKFAND